MRHRAVRAASSVLVATLAAGMLPGCGGGGGGSDPAPTLTLQIAATFDGYVKSDGFLDLNSGPNAIAVGDDGLNHGIRGFVRFPISGLPVGAHLVSATLRLTQSNFSGDPYAALGAGQPLKLDHVFLGGAIDATDFFDNNGLIARDVATLWTNRSPSTLTVDVTSSVANDLTNLRATSDFRLRFELGSNNDGFQSFTILNDSEDHAGGGLTPQLTLQYTQ